MSDGKGKGRATGGHDENPAPTGDQPPQTSTSLLNRVVASATGLSRSALAAPSGNEVLEAASGALAGSGKGQSARASSSSTWAETSSSTAPAGQSSQADRPQLPSFRSGHRDEHVQNAEAEFSSFLDGIDPFTPSNVESDEINLVERAWENAVSRENSGVQHYTSVQEQQLRDGDGVLELLSESRATDDTMDLSIEQDEVVNWNLTEDQLKVLRSVVNELFPPGQANIAPRADHPLNLIPGVALDGEQGRMQWMEQWDGVLNRYTDEVWGDLLPLVQEAREEVQLMKDDASGVVGEHPTALRRLGLVLSHLRQQ